MKVQIIGFRKTLQVLDTIEANRHCLDSFSIIDTSDCVAHNLPILVLVGLQASRTPDQSGVDRNGRH